MKLAPLLEDVFVKGDELLAAVNDDTRARASTKDRIATNKKPLGKITSMTRGEPVYYAFSYLNSDESTKILKSLKGSGPYALPATRRETFLDDATSHIANQLRKQKITADIIVSPKSSSSFLRDFATSLAKKLNVSFVKLDKFSKIEVIDLPADKAQALELIKKKFIDYKYMKAKFKGDFDKGVDEIAKSVYYNLKKHDGHLDAKAIFKQYGKFIKGFLKHDLVDNEEYDLLDKTVMVVDDVLSSGTTMTELFRIIKDDLAAKNVIGVTLFSRTSLANKAQ